LYGWFCLGEIAGRGFTFTGYQVWAHAFQSPFRRLRVGDC
jgi:hypothetical protein